jgi:ribonuclease HI
VGISARAELCAITAGLEIAWSRGITKRIIEWDSELVIDCITKESIKMDANYILIVKARELLKRDWEVVVQHAFREANLVADCLANFGLSKDLFDRGLGIITNPPLILYSFLHFDLIGSIFSRLI